MPINSLVTEVVKMVQAPKEIIVLYELDGTFRQIYTDGRPLPEINQPTWLGYSTAHWASSRCIKNAPALGFPGTRIWSRRSVSDTALRLHGSNFPEDRKN